MQILGGGELDALPPVGTHRCKCGMEISQPDEAGSVSVETISKCPAGGVCVFEPSLPSGD